MCSFCFAAFLCVVCPVSVRTLHSPSSLFPFSLTECLACDGSGSSLSSFFVSFPSSSSSLSSSCSSSSRSSFLLLSLSLSCRRWRRGEGRSASSRSRALPCRLDQVQSLLRCWTCKEISFCLFFLLPCLSSSALSLSSCFLVLFLSLLAFVGRLRKRDMIVVILLLPGQARDSLDQEVSLHTGFPPLQFFSCNGPSLSSRQSPRLFAALLSRRSTSSPSSSSHVVLGLDIHCAFFLSVLL